MSMKTLQKLVAVIFLLIVSHAPKAQTITPAPAKPYMYNKVARKLPTSISELEKAFNTPEGSIMKMRLNEMVFEGLVTSSIKRYDNLYSVIIKSSTQKNTVFAISKRINDDKTVTYSGRIINEGYADGFELIREEDGHYAMNKIQTEALIQDY